MTPIQHTVRQVICLCAQWCGSCRDYRVLFAQVAQVHIDAMFYWIDIEDEAEWLGDVDIEIFPTLLIVDSVDSMPQTRFYGPLLPYASILSRMLVSLTETASVAITPPTKIMPLLQALQSGQAESFRLNHNG